MAKIFIDGDFKNIEGRVNAWLAGEDWKLKAYRDFDNGTGPDLYKVAYGRAFGVDIETIEKSQRQQGKVMEVAGGYQGGIGSYLSMGPTYGIRPETLVEPVQKAVPRDVWQKTLAAYDKATTKSGLGREQWASIQTLVHAWRASNPRITASWGNLQRTAIMAVDNPGQTITVAGYRNVYYLVRGGFLWCRLPSGRFLTYFNPRIEVSKRKILVDPSNGQIHDLDALAPAALMDLVAAGAKIEDGRERRECIIDGKIAAGKKGAPWGRKHLYGGLQCENIVQATACDIQMAKMLDVDKAGFNICMHTHDNITAEIEPRHGHRNGEPDAAHQSDIEDFREIMRRPLSWAPDLPIEVEAHVGTRYAG